METGNLIYLFNQTVDGIESNGLNLTQPVHA
jgi:hypothetical protein